MYLGSHFQYLVKYNTSVIILIALFVVHFPGFSASVTLRTSSPTFVLGLLQICTCTGTDKVRRLHVAASKRQRVKDLGILKPVNEHLHRQDVKCTTWACYATC